MNRLYVNLLYFETEFFFKSRLLQTNNLNENLKEELISTIFVNFFNLRLVLSVCSENRFDTCSAFVLRRAPSTELYL